MTRPVKRLLKKVSHTWQNSETSLTLSCQITVDFSVFTVCVMGLVVDKILNSFQSWLIKILFVWVISNWQNARTDIWVASYLLILHISSCLSFLVSNTLNQTKTKQENPVRLPPSPRLHTKLFYSCFPSQEGTGDWSHCVSTASSSRWTCDQYLIAWSDFIRSAFLPFTLMNSVGEAHYSDLFFFDQVVTVLLPVPAH